MSDRNILDNKLINTSINNDRQSTLSKLNEYAYYSSYMLEPVVTKHTHKALHTFGLLGGPINNDDYTNIIDLESQLLGINTKQRYNTDAHKVDMNKKNKLNNFQLIDFKATII
jgi:hypothetical protein